MWAESYMAIGVPLLPCSATRLIGTREVLLGVTFSTHVQVASPCIVARSLVEMLNRRSRLAGLQLYLQNIVALYSHTWLASVGPFAF